MYKFSMASVIWGLVIIIIGVGVVYFHKQLSDFLGGGLGTHNRYKLFGIIAIVFGLSLLANIPQLILYSIFSLLFGK